MDTVAPERFAADLRTNRIIWFAVAMGVVLLVSVMTFLLSTGAGGTAENTEVFFYLNAGLNLTAILGAFAVQRSLSNALLSAESYEEAAALVRQRGILSIALLEGSALFAAVAAFLTGEVVNFAFVVPFFAFVALFFPTEPRYHTQVRPWLGDA